jgi:Ca2+-binding RTX toxin-like protein
VFTFEAQTAPGVFTTVSTGPTFTPGDAQVGQALRAVARFTDNAGFSERIASAATAAVVNINDVPAGAAVLSQPLPQEAETLSVNPSAVVDGDGLVGVTFAFQWQQSNLTGAFGANPNIAGATSPSYTPVQGDVGRLLRVRITFTDNHGTAETVFSTVSGEVGDVFVGTANADDYTGTAGRDNVSGLGGADTIQTGGVADVVNGGAGNDQINTGGGNDIVTGGAGDDVIGTGAENDIIRFGGAGTGFDDVTGGAGVDEIQATAANTVIGLLNLQGIESITGSGFANVTILGTDQANVFNFSAITLTGIARIDGAGGADEITGTGIPDVIFGGAGGDTLLGGGGNDVLNGGAAADTINGQAGNDDITGGAGNDTLSGGGGFNVFRFEAGFGNDTVNSFDENPANGGQDTLNLSALGVTAANFATRVTIAAAAGNTLVTVRNAAATVAGTITLTNVLPANVTVADFTFTP